MFDQKTPKNKLKACKTQPQDSVPSFIRKTYEILEENKFPEYIDWNPEGTAIVIKMPSEFSQKVLPAYFKHNNLTSFVRQLNMYNFHKKRTQNLDHVYFHELFRRDQKHLLKEIKRKNHDTIIQNPERSPVLYHSQSQALPELLNEKSVAGDMNSLAYENQFLKRLYNDAMSKAASLESQVKELSIQNRNLWHELCQLKGQNTQTVTDGTPTTYNSSCGNSIKIERVHSDLSSDQLPMTTGEISIPPLKLNNSMMNDGQQFNNGLRFCAANEIYTKSSNMNVNGYFNCTEDSTNSSEGSFISGSPSLHNHNESDKDFDNNDQYNTIPKLNQVPATSQNPFMQPQSSYKNGCQLRLTKKEMSLGQMLESWNGEEQDDEMMLAFADQKENVDGNVLGGSLLGKRGLESEVNGDFSVPEPAMKRNAYDQLNIFGRKGLSSIGVDDKDPLQLAFRRESELNEDYDTSVNIDLMDFNTSGPYSWTKSM
jgi:hypothetical protein